MYRGGRVGGAAAGATDEVIVAELAGDIVRLATGKSLIIAEFDTTKVTVWRVRPDSCGTPRVWRESRTWDLLQAWGMLDEPALAGYIRPGDGDLMVVARTGRDTEGFEAGRDADRAFDVAREAYPPARAFRSTASVDDLLAEATARVPLSSSVWYELVLLRRSGSGRIEFTAQQLFLPEARRGDTRTFTIRCEPSDENGTVFAVAARNPELDFQLLSMKSARLQPGTYTVTATLTRPGGVRFSGLPTPVRDDSRSWLDVLAVVPERLDVAAPAHLIIAVEVCGTQDDLRARADRARQLVRDAANADRPMLFSLVSYGAHTHDRRIPDEAVTTLLWAQADPGVIDQRLERLGERLPANSGHARAAQLECLLADVARRLRHPEAAAIGRPVLVMIGQRPASPHRIDQVSRIFPCPQRNDWRADLRGLSEAHAGMAFGAIRDGCDDDDDLFTDDPSDEVWRMLGTDAYARADVFNPRQFAIELGLRSHSRQYLPFPLLIPEGAD
jgi:hypothetical protein